MSRSGQAVWGITLSAAVVALVLGFGAAGCECSSREGSQRAVLEQAVSEQAIALAADNAHRIAAGDLSGDGRPEIVSVDAHALRVADLNGRELARRSVTGGIQVLRIADIDGDGRAEILAGWGRSREHQNAKAHISIYRMAADSLVEELVAQPSTSRNDVVEVLPVPGSGPPELLVAYFESKYMVRISKALLSETRWTLSPVDTIRMATSYALGDVDGDGQMDLVVGRVYGDDVDADGDAFILRPDGERVPIPVTGGVCCVVVSVSRHDGRDQLGTGRCETRRNEARSGARGLDTSL